MAVTPGRQLPMWAQGALLAAFWAVFLALQVFPLHPLHNTCFIQAPRQCEGGTETPERSVTSACITILAGIRNEVSPFCYNPFALSIPSPDISSSGAVGTAVVVFLLQPSALACLRRAHCCLLCL